jgi:uncharacterized protein YkwD
VLAAVLLAALPAPALGFSAGDWRHSLLHRLNHYRHSHGLHRLIIGPRLQRAATAHSVNMATHHMLSHSSWSGTSWLTRIRAYGFKGDWAGENLAVGRWTTRRTMRAWKASPAHNANLLNRHFRVVGIGIVRGIWSGHTAYYITADFGGP